MNTSFETLLDDQLTNIFSALSEKAVVLDDHGPALRERAVEGVVLVTTWQGTFLCPIFRREWTSLNQLYIGRDGRVHLSTRSVSGTLQGFPRFSDNFRLDSIESIREVARVGNDKIHDVRWFDVLPAAPAHEAVVVL